MISEARVHRGSLPVGAHRDRGSSPLQDGGGSMTVSFTVTCPGVVLLDWPPGGLLPHTLEYVCAIDEQPGREAVVTDSEKAADQMAQDILGGKIDRAGRQVVRGACDRMDAPPTGREADGAAIDRIRTSRKW